MLKYFNRFQQSGWFKRKNQLKSLKRPSYTNHDRSNGNPQTLCYTSSRSPPSPNVVGASSSLSVSQEYPLINFRCSLQRIEGSDDDTFCTQCS